ncbi:AbrB family transcriptional regulator [Candidatus Formimonas warabiya]|uniref:AbrB family transcriptional regulator n=1 Tax=Formimonas warabiya TaxID=1761012 RepID=A0A3G1L0A9_FORW1|nr:AbrB family transcriptional regulator [Candidatus Formimonas warabiya]ATW28100.1 hypothetical protein DCMF_28100 [Candidatus Formimonas warabiya]
MWARFGETLLVSCAGGLLFQLIHTPLPWMLGPLSLVMVWRQLLKRPLWWPVEIRNTALVILGYIIGNSFSPVAAVQIFRQLPAMFICTMATVLFSLLIAYLTSRGTGMSLSTGILGSIPGGLTQMVALTEEIKGVDISGVIFLQTFRLLAVVFVVPFLVIHGLSGNTAPGNAAGASHSIWTFTPVDPAGLAIYAAVALAATFLAWRLKAPTPFLTGPILGTAVLNMFGGTGPEVPRLLVIVAQLFMGAYMGQQMQLAGLSNWKRMLPFTLMGSLFLVLFSLVLGELLSMFHSVKLVNAFLSTAPGGISEMSITAIQVQGDLSLISAYQIFRVFFILFLVPPLLKRWLGSNTAKLSKFGDSS